MIGVCKDHRRIDLLLKVTVEYPFDCGAGANRHEDRRLYLAVSGAQDTRPGRCGSVFLLQDRRDSFRASFLTLSMVVVKLTLLLVVPIMDMKHIS